MKRFLASLLVVLCVAVPVRSVADDESVDEKPNCKLIVRTKFRDGKRRIQIMDVHTTSREECRLQARDRELSSDEDIASVKATFGFRPGSSR